jgi:phosphohistidine swiveling domain-containing protein
VTDTGGILNNTSITAREYGIPCVVAARNATRIIADGVLVTVDGAAGTVMVEGAGFVQG